MSISDIMARHRPILPQRGSALGSLGFSLRKITRIVTKPLTATARVVAAPLKVSAAIMKKLPGGTGISKALTTGAGLVVGTTTSPTTLLRPAAPAPTYAAPAPSSNATVPEGGAPPNCWPGYQQWGNACMPVGITATGATPQPGSGSIYSPAVPSGAVVDSSGAPMAQPMAAADASPVLAPWYTQPLILGGLAIAGYVGWRFYKRRHRRR